MTMRWLPWMLVLCGGCPRTEAGDASMGSDDAAPTTAPTGEVTSGDATTTAQDESPTAETADSDPATTSSETGSTTEAAETSTGEPPPIQLCGLEDLKPGAPNPVVSG